MKKTFPLILIYFSLITIVKCQVPEISFLNFEQKKILQKFNTQSRPSQCYFVLIDMNDCINCNLPFKILLNSHKITSENSILAINNLNKSKISAFRKEFAIDDSIRITTDSSLIKTLISILPKKNNNAIFNFKNQYVIKSLALKFATDDNNFKQLDIEELKVESSTTLKNDNVFYNHIEQTTMFNNEILTIVGPKAALFAFDSTFTVKKYFSFNDTFLIEKAYSSILNHFHDTIKSNAYNSIDSIIKFYNQDIKPLGLNVMKLNALSICEDQLYVSGSISLPVTTGFDKIFFAPGLFVFIFDKKLELKAIQEYQLHIHTASGPVDFYGFKAKNADTLLINVQRFKEDKFNNNFLGTWVKEKNYYKYRGLNKKIILTENVVIKAYFDELKQLIYKFRYIDDSTLAFEYLPYILNMKNNQLTRNINQECELRYIAYNLKNVEKIWINNSCKYILIEKFYDNTYVSITDLSFKRKRIYKVPKITNSSESFFVLKDKLYSINLTDDGTIINQLWLN